MSFDRIAFQYYDPFTDVKLCPTNSNDVYSHPNIPASFYDTVRRTNNLVKHLSINDLNESLATVEEYIARGLLAGIRHPSPLYNETDYQPADGADTLFSFFEHEEHKESLERKSELFGILAAANNGTIYNQLWPGEEIRETKKKQEQLNNSIGAAAPAIYSFDLIDLMFDSTKAVLFGELFALRAHYGKDKSISEKNSLNAKQSKKAKNEIFAEWVTWAMTQPIPNNFASLTVARSHFISNVLSTRLHPHLSDNTNRTMDKKLKAVIEKSGHPHPFLTKN